MILSCILAGTGHCRTKQQRRLEIGVKGFIIFSYSVLVVLFAKVV